MFNYFSFRTSCPLRDNAENIAEPVRPQITIWKMHFACWIPKSTDSHLEYLKKKSSPVTGLEWPRGFQGVKVPRFHNNGTGRW